MSGNNSKISSCFIKISSFIASPSHSPPPKWGAKMNYALWCLVQYPSFQKLKKHSFEKNLWKVFLFSVKVFYYVTFLYSTFLAYVLTPTPSPRRSQEVSKYSLVQNDTSTTTANGPSKHFQKIAIIIWKSAMVMTKVFGGLDFKFILDCVWSCQFLFGKCVVKQRIGQNGQITFRKKATAFFPYAKWLLINWPFALLRLHILIDK